VDSFGMPLIYQIVRQHLVIKILGDRKRETLALG